VAGVYISYPFCAQKCTYCNFASGVFPRRLEEQYAGALCAELRATEWPWTPETVYLGGGTPSQMDPAALARVLAAVPGRPWNEATLEAAPGGITAAQAAAWREAGIDRVSLGVQSFEAAELRQTGRKHDAATVQREIAVLRGSDIANINIDLIAGLPHQTRASWLRSLDWVERLEVPHVSVYMLEVDEDSRLGAEILASGARYGAAQTPGEDQVAEFYELAVERLAGMGIRRYEISNFARPGFESRHNLKYWRREPYLGFGADAHSFDGAWRWQNIGDAAHYVRAVRAGQPPVSARAPADAESERLFLGLRLDGGVAELPSPFAEPIERFVREGLLLRQDGRLRLTPRGVLLSNEVFAEFVEAPA
jgi:oxygen-independent coproporphyrinogen-3 oxidase